MDEIRAEGVGPVLGDAGPPAEFEFRGRTWKVGHPVQAAKAELEKLVLQYVLESHEAMRGVWPDAKFAAKEKELDELIYGRHYRTWGSLWKVAVNGPDGNALLLLSLLKAHQPAAALDDARAMWANATRQVLIAYAQVMPDFFSALVASHPGTPEEKALALGAAVAQAAALLHAATPPGAPTDAPPG
jgi:hypothetical protein